MTRALPFANVAVTGTMSKLKIIQGPEKDQEAQVGEEQQLLVFHHRRALEERTPLKPSK